MSDTLLADACVCGVPNWHRLADNADAAERFGQREASRVLWCKKCGSIRAIFDTCWQIPLDRAHEVVCRAPPPLENNDEDRHTKPGTPEAKKKDP
jgi:hypothetical protein